MAKNIRRNPKTAPTKPFPAAPNKLHEQGGWLWIPLRDKWRDVAGKPEEIVRQHFIHHLCDSYDYALDQMDQERRTMHGHKSPRADIVIWETPKAKAANKTPVLVIECKAENIDINIKDYYQGESYSRAVGCRVLHRPQRSLHRRFQAGSRPTGRVHTDQRDREGDGLGRCQADRGDQKQAPSLQPEGVPGPPVQVPLDLARRSQDGPRTRIRHDLEGPVREDVRGTLGPARHVHSRLPRPPRFDAPPNRSACSRWLVRADEGLLQGRRPFRHDRPP